MSVLSDHPPRSICVLRLSALGDVCHTVPVVRTLQAAWPECRVTWIVGGVEAQLLEGLEDVEFITVDKSRGWRGYAAVRARLAGRRFDVLLHMHPSMRANIASLFVRAPVRLGFDRARAKDQQWLFTNRRIAAVPRQHVLEGLFGFAAALGVGERQLCWDIPIPESARRYAAGVIPDGRPTAIVSPCATAGARDYRDWPPERFAAVIDALAEDYGVASLLTGGGTRREREAGRLILAHSRHPPRNLIGATGLKELLALIARARLVVCPDSGPAHMATSVATPAVTLFATTNPERAAPWGSRHLVVNRYPEACRRYLGQSPEQLRWGVRVRRAEAMRLIGVGEVMERIGRALAD
jgi:heptosyltransferase I